MTTSEYFTPTLEYLKYRGRDLVQVRGMWEVQNGQLSYADMDKLIEYGGFQTAAVSSIGKTQTIDYDGPGAAFHSGTGHPSEVIVACSWSDDVARLMGESIGREGAARGLTGWYAPGINTHRSPFGGRNFEYYSPMMKTEIRRRNTIVTGAEIIVQ